MSTYKCSPQHRELVDMVEKIENYERLLRDLSLRASDEDQSLIRRALQNVSFSPPTLVLGASLTDVRRVSMTPKMYYRKQALRNLSSMSLLTELRSLLVNIEYQPE